MTAIWRNDGNQWNLLSPTSFPDEQTLHSLVEEAPQTLPLAGAPGLTILGREVRLGSGYADLIAVEPDGRLVIIEIKLSRNTEARRAVVAQVLGYAAYLYGLTVEELERDVLGSHLRSRGRTSIADAIAQQDQAGQLDRDSFYEALAENLANGDFRLVMVLDAAPDELVRIAGFLEQKTSSLLVDIVSMAAYDIGGSQVLIPQRLEPGRQRTEPPADVHRPVRSASKGYFVEGAEDFEKSVELAPADDQPMLRRLSAWARELETRSLASLGTYHGKLDRTTLLPTLPADNVGLVTIWNDKGAALQFWRSVFERRAPKALAEVEKLIAPLEVRQGNQTREVSDELLAALTRAYEEANASSSETRELARVST